MKLAKLQLGIVILLAAGCLPTGTPPPPRKAFKLGAEQIRPIATGYGACFATDMITVEGRRVGYMYREAPDFAEDSGWRFLSGSESETYMNDADNTGLYDVNTIANYDPEITPFLNAPVGSAFERQRESGPLVPATPSR